jgi:tight adherence protein B
MTPRAAFPRFATPRRPAPASGPSAAEVAVLAEQLAGLTQAGLPPGRSWRALAERAGSPAVRSLAGDVVTGQYRGLSPATTLRAVAARADHDDGALRQLAVVVDVSERTGAPLSDTALRLAGGLRSEQAAAEERLTALAGPRAGASVLTLLPIAGLGLGALLGGHPGRVLLGTAPGRVCLVLGGVLWVAGRFWTRALIRRAAR